RGGLPSSSVRRWAPDARSVVGAPRAVCALLLAPLCILAAGCGSSGNKTAVTTTAIAAQTTTVPPGVGTNCSSLSTTWRLPYNKTAKKQSNPIRVLDACCKPTERAGISHCFVAITLAGTHDRGCESVDIDADGKVAGPGKHEKCPPEERKD